MLDHQLIGKSFMTQCFGFLNTAMVLSIGLSFACTAQRDSFLNSKQTRKDSSEDNLAGSVDDMIYGKKIPRVDSFYVEGADIYRGFEKVHLKGVNWFGFDTEKLGLHGLWSGRSLQSFLDQTKELGFNALRIPLSPQALDSSLPGSDGYDSPVAQLEDLMRSSEERGINILFDFHNCHYSLGHFQARPDESSGVCEGYGKQGWISDLKKLATMVQPYSNVVGIDLFNEPYGTSWSEWRSFVDEGARAVLETNPKILVFVEGVGGSSDNAGGYEPFWGANLFDALNDPVSVPRSRLVFSPHSYGPSVFDKHSYFNDSAFPGNMPEIWNTHFGYLADNGYPLAVGEFGGRYTEKDKLWQDAFVDYLLSKNISHFFYWSLNPNSGDTGGILKDDWMSVDEEKIELLKPLLMAD